MEKLIRYLQFIREAERLKNVLRTAYTSEGRHESTAEHSWRLALLAAALVFAKREHMRMGFLADKFSGNALRWIYIFSELLVILFAALIMIYGGTSITKLTMTQVTASLGIPMSMIYVIVPICGIFVILFGVINIYELLRAKEVKPLSAKKETVISNKSAVVQKAIVKGDK